MNVQRDPDAILAAWLEEGRTSSPIHGASHRVLCRPSVNRGLRWLPWGSA